MLSGETAGQQRPRRTARARHHAPGRSRGARAPASAAATSAPPSSRSSRVLENCRLAAQARHPRPWAWWAEAARAARVSVPAARDALAARRPGRRGRTAPAGTLSPRPAAPARDRDVPGHRSREVLLLDEPLAGMGAEETERMLALLRELKAGHAILLVEHDMDAVFRIADRITVMVNGAVHRQRRARRPSAGQPPRCRPPTWAAPNDAACDAALLEAQGLHAWYGASHVLHGVDLAIARGETVGLLGRNGMGKTHADPHPAGPRAQREGRIVIDGRDMSRAPAARAHGAAGHRLRARGPRHLPQPDGAREPGDGARAPAAGRPRATGRFERVLQTFPRLAERLDHGGAAALGRRAADAGHRPRADDATRS